MKTQIKERPILFSSLMVRAILDGRKSQTRRVIKKQPTLANGRNKYEFSTYTDDEGINEYWTNKGYWHARCPHGKISDRLWVREAWNYDNDLDEYYYKADSDVNVKWKPSIHMPRRASRILLEITNVRVERLNDISEKDAIAEGIDRVGGKYSCSPWRNYRIGKPGEMSCHCSYPPSSYMTLWESINGPGSWSANPWVWVVEFKRIG